MSKDKKASDQNAEKPKITIQRDGPLAVTGNVPLKKEIIGIGAEDEPETWIEGEHYPQKAEYTLCRCGQSKNHPYCDGTHKEVGWDGTETASRKNYRDACDNIEGPDLILSDSPDLCAVARFCHISKGTWGLTRESDDPEKKAMAIQQAYNCPSGRLVAREKKTGKVHEPAFEPSISLIEDPQKNVSGPLWVKGGIPIESADGTPYEVRNRVTLCRCGQSKNKPFCDGSHIGEGFSDGDESLS